MSRPRQHPPTTTSVWNFRLKHRDKSPPEAGEIDLTVYPLDRKRIRLQYSQLKPRGRSGGDHGRYLSKLTLARQLARLARHCKAESISLLLSTDGTGSVMIDHPPGVKIGRDVAERLSRLLLTHFGQTVAVKEDCLPHLLRNKP